MTGTHELFTSWSETDSNLHVEVGTHAKCGVEGVGIVRFQLELRGSLKVADVFYVPKLRTNLLSVSPLEDKGYAILFQNEQVFTRSEGASPDTAVTIGVEEGLVDKLQGKPIRGSKGILDHGYMSVTENENEKRRLRRMSKVHRLPVWRVNLQRGRGI
jgi:hypothetical protein